MSIPKALLSIAAAVSMSGSAVAGQVTGVQGQTPTEREVRAAEEQMHKAYATGDKALFSSLYADDSTFTYSRGETVGRDERVKRFSEPFKNLRDEIVSIKVLGDIALVRCLSKYSNATTTGDTEITILRVWQKRQGKWVVVAFQSTPVTRATA
jgi:uncharacterized protein (TIGR02246 family)